MNQSRCRRQIPTLARCGKSADALAYEIEWIRSQLEGSGPGIESVVSSVDVTDEDLASAVERYFAAKSSSSAEAPDPLKVSASTPTVELSARALCSTLDRVKVTEAVACRVLRHPGYLRSPVAVSLKTFGDAEALASKLLEVASEANTAPAGTTSEGEAFDQHKWDTATEKTRNVLLGLQELWETALDDDELKLWLKSHAFYRPNKSSVRHHASPSDEAARSACVREQKQHDESTDTGASGGTASENAHDQGPRAVQNDPPISKASPESTGNGLRRRWLRSWPSILSGGQHLRDGSGSGI